MEYDESKEPCQTVDFPYSEVEAALAKGGPLGLLGRIQSDPVGVACESHFSVWHWIYQNGSENTDGFLCRCIIASWVFNPILHAKSMTDIARDWGKKKQSLGRWVEDFKREFPEVSKRFPHIKNA